MPTYGYACDNCGNEFEVWQRMTDSAIATCPVCATLGRQIFYPAGVVFKGSGFYKTDSRGSSGGGSSSGSSATPAKPKAGDTPASSDASSAAPASPPAEKSSGDTGAKSSDTGGKATDSGSAKA